MALLRKGLEHLAQGSMRFKIMGLTMSVIFLLGAMDIWLTRQTLYQALQRQWALRGAALAGELTVSAGDAALTDDLYRLHVLVRSTVSQNADVRYALVISPDGSLLANSYGQRLPAGLWQANRPGPGGRSHTVLLNTSVGPIEDVAVSMDGGQAGYVRLGLGEADLNHSLDLASGSLLLAMTLVAVLGIVAAVILTELTTKPLTLLARSFREVPRRGFAAQGIGLVTAVEIRQLAEAYRDMLQELAGAESQRLAVAERLDRRHRELNLLFLISTSLGTFLREEELLARIGRRLLDFPVFVGLQVFLKRDEGLCLVYEDGESGEATLPSEGQFALRRLPPGSGLPPAIEVALGARQGVMGYLRLYGISAEDLDSFEPEPLVLLGHQLGSALLDLQLRTELQERHRQYGLLVQKIITAQEEERKRIARELHDETGQILSAVVLHLGALAGPISDVAEFNQRLEALRSLVASGIQEVHRLAVELRPRVLDDLGLIPAIQRYLVEHRSTVGPEIDLQLVGLDLGSRFRPEVETTLYRIVQEALSNVFRHAVAQAVSVILERRGDWLRLIVEDDGVGFAVGQVANSSELDGQLGLYGMQERALLLGGSFHLESRPGMGTTVYVTIPATEIVVGGSEYA